MEMGDAATLQAICCRLGLAIPGLHMRTRCLPSCTQMGPHAQLTESTVRENILTGQSGLLVHFLGCKSCGTYDRHNQVAQVALAYLRYELKFTGATSSVGSNFVGPSHSADGKSNLFKAHGRTGLPVGKPRLAEIGHRCERCEPNCSQPLGCRCMW